MGKTRWKRLVDQDGNLAYEGFASEDNSPWGSGTAYYPDGKTFREGLWGEKGFLAGREYYPNGQIRFEGAYRYNGGYGPNFPVYGKYYSETGTLEFEGAFKVRKSGVGWPFVDIPETFGKVLLDDSPIYKQHWAEENPDQDGRKDNMDQGENWK